jgi:hypothetical protein
MVSWSEVPASTPGRHALRQAPVSSGATGGERRGLLDPLILDLLDEVGRRRWDVIGQWAVGQGFRGRRRRRRAARDQGDQDEGRAHPGEDSLSGSRTPERHATWMRR